MPTDWPETVPALPRLAGVEQIKRTVDALQARTDHLKETQPAEPEEPEDTDFLALFNQALTG